MADFLKEHPLVQKLLILALFIYHPFLTSEFGRTELIFDILVSFATLLTIASVLWIITFHLLGFENTQNQEAVKGFEIVGWNGGLFVLYLTLLAPLTEELMFRKLAFRLFQRVKTYHLDLFLSSVVFSLVHVLIHSWSWNDFVMYFGLGLIYGAVYKISNSLYVSFASHVLWNCFILTIMVLS